MIKCKNACPLEKFNGCCASCPNAGNCPEKCELKPDDCADAVFEGTALEVFTGKQAAVIAKISSLVKQKAEIEAAEKEMRDVLQKAMEAGSIKDFSNEVIKITYVEASSRASVDSTKLKNKYPDIAAECTKSSAVKAYVKIELRGDKK